MPKSEPTPLLAAATAFDEQLTTYTRLAESFMKTPLGSVKHLERANQLLAELAACEQRLQDTGKHLIEALAAARQTQERLASEVVGHAPEVQARNQRLQELMNEMAQLASDAAAVTAQVSSRAGQALDLGALSAGVLALSTRAEQLAATARDASFEEVATQAHGLHQKLKVIGQKLQKAPSN
jgi:DNA repair exonuclease SbcCD ATPase subunit